MRLLHTSDFHLDAVTAGVPRFDDVAEALDQTVAAAVEEKVDLYVCTGDAANADCGRVAFRVILKLLDVAYRLSQHGIPSVWVAGNHDVADDGHGTTVLSPLRVLRDQGVRVYEEPDCWTTKWGTMVALPYPPRAAKYDPADYVRNSCNGVLQGEPLIVFGHLTIPLATMGSESRELARGGDVDFPEEALRAAARGPLIMLNGHYHRRQVVGGQGGIYIPGSTVRLRFDEEDNTPGYQIVEVPPWSGSAESRSRP